MPMTVEELIDAVRRLADSNFATAASINKLLPVWEQLRRDVYDLRMNREIDQPTLQTALGQLKTDLVVLIKDVQRTEVDVKRIREATGTFALQQQESTVERIIKRAENWKTSTKILAAVLLLSFGLGGFGHLLISLLTGG